MHSKNSTTSSSAAAPRRPAAARRRGLVDLREEHALGEAPRDPPAEEEDTRAASSPRRSRCETATAPGAAHGRSMWIAIVDPFRRAAPRMIVGRVAHRLSPSLSISRARHDFGLDREDDFRIPTYSRRGCGRNVRKQATAALWIAHRFEREKHRQTTTQPLSARCRTCRPDAAWSPGEGRRTERRPAAPSRQVGERGVVALRALEAGDVRQIGEARASPGSARRSRVEVKQIFAFA